MTGRSCDTIIDCAKSQYEYMLTRLRFHNNSGALVVTRNAMERLTMTPIPAFRNAGFSLRSVIVAESKLSVAR